MQRRTPGGALRHGGAPGGYGEGEMWGCIGEGHPGMDRGTLGGGLGGEGPRAGQRGAAPRAVGPGRGLVVRCSPVVARGDGAAQRWCSHAATWGSGTVQRGRAAHGDAMPPGQWHGEASHAVMQQRSTGQRRRAAGPCTGATWQHRDVQVQRRVAQQSEHGAPAVQHDAAAPLHDGLTQCNSAMVQCGAAVRWCNMEQPCNGAMQCNSAMWWNSANVQHRGSVQQCNRVQLCNGAAWCKSAMRCSSAMWHSSAMAQHGAAVQWGTCPRSAMVQQCNTVQQCNSATRCNSATWRNTANV